MIASMLVVPCLSSTEIEVESDDYWTTADDIKKATIINLLRVMGETRALNVDVPIVFNRDSELFQSYLEQRRTPRKVDYGLPDTLFYEDIKDIKPIIKEKKKDHHQKASKGHHQEPSKGHSETSEETSTSHLEGTFVHPKPAVEESKFEFFPAVNKPTYEYERPETTTRPKATTIKPVKGYQVYETTTRPYSTTTSYFPSTTVTTTPTTPYHTPTTTPRPIKVFTTTPRTYGVLVSTTRPHTTQKTYMKLVNEQPYTTNQPFYPQTTTVSTTNHVTSSYGGRGTLTFLESPNPSPVKTFSAYQGQLQPVEPSPTPEKPKFYYKPIVEPVYNPSGQTRPVTVNHLPVIKYNPAPPPPPPPPPPPSYIKVVNHGYKNSQVEYTTPHPLIYGFKPVVKSQVKYKTPVLQGHQVKHTTTNVLNGYSSKPVDYLKGNFRINYQSGPPAHPAHPAPPVQLGNRQPRPIHHHKFHNTKPIRFPPGRLFRSVF